MSAVLTLAAKSLWNRRLTAALTVFAVAVSVMLFVGVEKLREGARQGFERTISDVDLIVGARSGPVNLLLYSVFRIGAPTNNITWQTVREIADHPNVAWTVPISLGDSHRGYRVVGTTTAFFERYKYAGDRDLVIADGAVFDDVFDAVLGAAVARELGYGLGDEVALAHGVGPVAFGGADHADKPFTVVGILAPTGTPVDRAVHVSLEGIEAIHIGWESGAPSPLARLTTPERARMMDLTPESVTAVFVGLDSKRNIFALQRALNTYREEPLLAIIPGPTLQQLWTVIGVAERALAAVAAFVVAVGLVRVLTSNLTSVNERRREMAILRATGARPRDVFTLLVSECALLAFAGAVFGLVALYAALAVLGPVLETRFGVAMAGKGPSMFDVYAVLGVTGVAALLGLIPAWRAFRNALADGLTVRV